MVQDLYYFHESDLDKTNLLDFKYSLPSHLRSKFEDSLHAKISALNVLQGYRGPSEMCNGGSGDSQELRPSHGLQEIKYWWGTRKDLNYVPLYGPVIYAGERISQKICGELNWSSLYFDSKTGECLSHDEDEAAEKLNKRGLELYKEGKYSESAEYHHNAYQSCSEGYHNGQKFLNNARKAESKSEEKSSTADSHNDSQRNFHQFEARRSVFATEDRQRQTDERDDYCRRWAIDEPNRRETHAEALCADGDYSMRHGYFREAAHLYEQALQTSQAFENRWVISRRLEAAQTEIEALERNLYGDFMFAQNCYNKAKEEYQEALKISQVHEQRQKYKKDLEKAQAEIDAQNLNDDGNICFDQGNYSEARDSYARAHFTSHVSSEIQKYSVNICRAEEGRKAVQINSEGENLYRQGKHKEALLKFQGAYTVAKASSCREQQKYANNCAKAQTEIDARNLNSEGDNLFKQYSYTNALNKYEEAHNKSKITTEKQIYAANIGKAHLEIEAGKLNTEGCNLFKERKYNEALSCFQKAYNTSQVSKDKQIYSDNCAKAQTEIDARNLNSEGDNLFKQCSYTNALNKYEEAYNKSKITTDKQTYAANKGKAQAIVSKLMMLDALWKQAWDAENDIQNDRCDEAKDLFEKILSEARSSLEMFPGSLKLKQYDTLVTLKIEGNEIFNEGAESQLNGITLFEEALELNHQAKYKLANVKFHEAKIKFLVAQKTFEKGSQSDQRFEDCIKFVQERINVVTDSINVTEQHILALDLRNLDVNVGNDKPSDVQSCKTGKDNEYIAQI